MQVESQDCNGIPRCLLSLRLTPMELYEYGMHGMARLSRLLRVTRI